MESYAMDDMGMGRSSPQHRRAMMRHEVDNFKEMQHMAYTWDNYILPLFQPLYALAPKSTKLSQLQCIPIFGNIYVFFLHLKFISKSRKFVCLDSSTNMKLIGIAAITLLMGFIPFANVWLTYKMQPLNTCWRIFSNDIFSKGLYPGISEAGMRTEFATSSHGLHDRPMSHMSTHLFQDNREFASPHTASTATLNGTPVAKGFNDGRLVDDRTTREKRGYSSFCPVPGRDTMSNYHEDYYYDGDKSDTRKHSFESLRVSVMPEEADFLKKKYSVRKSALDNWPLH
ncbi:hypothetical protein GGI25_002893 [Coemansia spiralis]|uniref:Uncharacterized protein n=2 Tax=Coemansia TaxID=4863 RepID=A0A9W8G839_9FUNG|nr:hypothetical protein GGI26_003406 [Coemansia sp. RSA 1358]KAJ2677795.1 hypothetical protein GGI25_002893 [Coemansia spiralis]